MAPGCDGGIEYLTIFSSRPILDHVGGCWAVVFRWPACIPAPTAPAIPENPVKLAGMRRQFAYNITDEHFNVDFNRYAGGVGCEPQGETGILIFFK